MARWRVRASLAWAMSAGVGLLAPAPARAPRAPRVHGGGARQAGVLQHSDCHVREMLTNMIDHLTEAHEHDVDIIEGDRE